VALPDDLLAQARFLARREPKRPRQASLRRAISAAYYALYHLLVSVGASAMAPRQPSGLRPRVQRAFAHDEMKRVCQQFLQGHVGSLTPALQALVADPMEPELATIADAFVALQEARHSADYDTTELFEVDPGFGTGGLVGARAVPSC
jgi:hypothetical protein